MTKFLLPFLLLTPILFDLSVPSRVASAQETFFPPAVGGGCVVDTIVSGQDVEQPLSLAFASRDNGVFFFTERSKGLVRIVERGRLNPVPFASLHVSTNDERGALGVAAHPYYPDSPFVYVLYNRLGDRANIVVRFRDSSAIGVDPQVIFAVPRLGVHTVHEGGSLSVGPDGTLYVGISEYHGEGTTDDDGNSGAKVYRIMLNGDIPEDNPEGENPLWWLRDHGSVNLAFNASKNICFGTGNNLGYKASDGFGVVGTRTLRPTSAFPIDSLPHFESIAMYEGTAFPRLRSRLLAVSRQDPHVWVLEVSDKGDTIIAATRTEFPFLSPGYRNVAVGPAGGIYLITTRGSIIRFRPFPPQFLSAASTLATQDVEYRYTPLLSGTPAVVSVLSGPEGVAFDRETGILHWTPTNAEALRGQQIIILQAENGAGLVDQVINVSVANVNDAPQAVRAVAPSNDTTFAFKGETPFVTLFWSETQDPDGDSVQYSVQVDTMETFGKPLVQRKVLAGTSTILAFPPVSRLYYWKVIPSDGQLLGTGESRRINIQYIQPSRKVAEEKSKDEEPTLEQNFPNPFNPTTSIKYILPKQGHVHLGVFNMLGQEVAVVLDGVQPAGTHEVEFKNIDLPSGIYFYRIQAPDFVETRKMVIAR